MEWRVTVIVYDTAVTAGSGASKTTMPSGVWKTTEGILFRDDPVGARIRKASHKPQKRVLIPAKKVEAFFPITVGMPAVEPPPPERLWSARSSFQTAIAPV